MIAGKVILGNTYGRCSAEPAGAFQVVTVPPLRPFCQRFDIRNSSEPFSKALGFAVGAAAALGFELVDETGRIAPAMCAALVADAAGKGGATVTPIEFAMAQRAERAAGVETSTIAPGPE